MRISVAMATHNGEQFLAEQLDSILAQSRRPDELVVCDDASADNTLRVLRQFAASCSMDIHIIENTACVGYVAAFEQALSRCGGEVVLLSDQDDQWFPGKVERLADILASRPQVLLVQSDMELADASLAPAGVTQLENILALGRRASDFRTGCGQAFRRSLLDVALPIPDQCWGHDSWLYSVAHQLDRVALLREPLMYYRRHDDNASQWLASRAQPLTRMQVLRAQHFEDASAGWRDESQRMRDLASRFATRSEALARAGLREAAIAAQPRMQARRNAMDQRISCVQRPRWRRAPAVLSLWMRGVYGEFAGWKSALKDLLRP